MLRYGVVSLCGTDGSPIIWTPILEVPGGPLDVGPDAFDLVLPTDADTVLLVQFRHPYPGPLTLNLETPRICANEAVPPRTKPACVAVSVSPLTLDLPAFSERQAEVTISTSGSPPGLYFGGITFSVSDQQETWKTRWAIPIQLTVDWQTGISGDTLDLDDESAGRGAIWRISPRLNPFSDEMVVRIAPIGGLTPGGTSASSTIEMGTMERIDYSVFDIAGRLRRAGMASIPLSAQNGALIRIPGTADWPSGVYLCRVCFRDQILTVKMLHVK